MAFQQELDSYRQVLTGLPELSELVESAEELTVQAAQFVPLAVQVHLQVLPSASPEPHQLPF